MFKLIMTGLMFSFGVQAASLNCELRTYDSSSDATEGHVSTSAYQKLELDKFGQAYLTFEEPRRKVKASIIFSSRKKMAGSFDMSLQDSEGVVIEGYSDVQDKGKARIGGSLKKDGVPFFARLKCNIEK